MCKRSDIAGPPFLLLFACTTSSAPSKVTHQIHFKLIFPMCSFCISIYNAVNILYSVKESRSTCFLFILFLQRYTCMCILLFITTVLIDALYFCCPLCCSNIAHFPIVGLIKDYLILSYLNLSLIQDVSFRDMQTIPNKTTPGSKLEFIASST